MAVLGSALEQTDGVVRRQARMQALVAELRERSELGCARRRRDARSSGTARGASCRRGSGSTAWWTRDGVPGAEPARRLGRVRRRGAVGGDRDRDRRDRGARVRGRRERRDGEGRLVLPADGEEAPARPGGRRAEWAAVRLPRRLGRGVSAAAGRGVPRPRPFRADLLQPGADVGEGDPADRGRDGLVHRRRRLCAGDERRDGDRGRNGDDLHRRPAAREGSDRAGRDCGGAGRRRRPHPPVRRRRPLRDVGRARARARAADRRELCTSASRHRPGRSPPPSRPPTTRRSCTA